MAIATRRKFQTRGAEPRGTEPPVCGGDQDTAEKEGSSDPVEVFRDSWAALSSDFHLLVPLFLEEEN